MDQVLVFDLGEERYGLEVGHIQEVADSPDLHYIPQAPDYFLGAINFHGQILPVLDLCHFLDFPAGSHDPRKIVLAAEGTALALAATAVHRIVPLATEALLPFQGSPGRESFIRAVFHHQGQMINLLDLPRLLRRLDGA